MNYIPVENERRDRLKSIKIHIILKELEHLIIRNKHIAIFKNSYNISSAQRNTPTSNSALQCGDFRLSNIGLVILPSDSICSFSSVLFSNISGAPSFLSIRKNDSFHEVSCSCSITRRLLFTSLLFEP
jgi:hypothetical protein